jgi:hypothetical protein
VVPSVPHNIIFKLTILFQTLHEIIALHGCDRRRIQVCEIVHANLLASLCWVWSAHELSSEGRVLQGIVESYVQELLATPWIQTKGVKEYAFH